MSSLIADAHCDLLAYLEADPTATPFDEVVRCSIPQLRQGGIGFQGLAIYCATDDQSVKRGMGQAGIFQELPQRYPEHFHRVRRFADIAQAREKGKIAVMAAIENASGFSHEDEPLEAALRRLDQLLEMAGPIFYISLTHFGQNRFAGGNATQGVGLKSDGKALLEYLSGKKIAIDMSHTSDAAAYDILDFLNQKNLDIPVIASHSNFRTVTLHDRNLPDDVAAEIIRRKGLIGMNFIRDFMGTEGESSFLRQLEYALKLGAEKCLCLGADFFHTEAYRKLINTPDRQFFHEGFDSSACYPKWVDLIQKNLKLPPATLDAITHNNMFRFLESVLS